MKRDIWNIDSKGEDWLQKFIEISGRSNLLLMLIKRDFISYYKQTILGPLWILIQPLLSSVVFGVIFGKLGKLGSSELPTSIFYLSGFILWGFFSECITKTSTLFRDNMNLFGKVYFPRIIIPISIVSSAMIRIGFQLVLLFTIGVWTIFNSSYQIFSINVLWLPVGIIMMALQGFGIGLVVAAATTRYRDLSMVVNFGVQLLLFSTSTLYSPQNLPAPYRTWVELNPLTTTIEIFRMGLGSKFVVNINALNITIASLLILPLIGIFSFFRVEKNFVDTI